MSFVVSARKYRPQNFDEVIGQDHVAQTLKRALENDQLAHAFLFAGPRGVGKTTSARILAKVLNCENLQDGYKACGECNACKSFMENASFNIFELDAASNNSVEHIRALNEQVRFQPQQGAYKIYIIDEVHMLSQAAFNAFLKTLEEPPPYAKFILATTEKHKIIPTILSRCQIFDFKRIQIKDIVVQLQEIANKENKTIADDALHLIAQKADGAMRDALSIYDKIISSVEGDISYKDVAENLNVLDYEFFFKIVDAAIKEDMSEVMLINNDIIRKGFESEQFVLGLMNHLRDLLMVKDVRTAEILDIPESLRPRYEQQAVLASNSFLLSALNVLNEMDINLPRSQNKRLSVEIALSKMCYLNRIIDKKKTGDLSVDSSPEKGSTVSATKKEEVTPPLQVTKDPVIDISDKPALKEESPESVQEPIEKLKEVEPQKKAETVNEETVPSEGTTINQIKSDKNPSVIKTPTLSSNLDVFLNGGVNKKTKKKQTKVFDLDGVQEIFDTYQKKTTSPSVKSAITNIKIELAGSDILILSPIQIYLDFIRQETPLIELLHETYSNSYNKILYEVSEKTFPNYEAPKKPKHLTTSDKYELLVQKNPHFVKFVDAFKLKVLNN
jgi:DNA polymerase-3 subunit gamma/tau